MHDEDGDRHPGAWSRYELTFSATDDVFRHYRKSLLHKERRRGLSRSGPIGDPLWTCDRCRVFRCGA